MLAFTSRFNIDVNVRGYCIRASATMDPNDLWASLTDEKRSAVLRLRTERLQTLAPSAPVESRSLQTQATQDTANAAPAQAHVHGSLGGQTTARTASGDSDVPDHSTPQGRVPSRNSNCKPRTPSNTFLVKLKDACKAKG